MVDKNHDEELKKYIKLGFDISTETSNEDLNMEEITSLIMEFRALAGLPISDKIMVFDSPISSLEATTLIDGIDVSKTPGLLSSYNTMYSQNDCAWLVHSQFCIDVLGETENVKETALLMKLTKHIGSLWLRDEGSYIAYKPTEMHLIEKPSNNSEGLIKVLHNENGMAVKFRDGRGIYALNDVRIPIDLAWIVTTPKEDLKLADVLGINNVTIRTEALKKMGPENGAGSRTKLDELVLPKGGKYTLYEVDLNVKTENDEDDFSDEIQIPKRLYLEGSCPSSGKPFFEGVAHGLTSCTQALNWRMYQDDLDRPIEEPDWHN